MSTYTTQYYTNSKRRRYEITKMAKGEILKLKTGCRLMELGCGDMQTLKTISRLRPDLQLYGVDIGEPPLGTLHDGIEFIRSDIGDFSPDQDFDFVFCADILEHLPAAQDLALCIRRILSDTGRFYISVPSVTNLFLFGDENFYSDYSHVRPFNSKSLNRLLDDNGLRVEQFGTADDTSKPSFKGLRLIYYFSRGVLLGNSGYINAAMRLIGGTSIEAVGSRQ